MNLLFLNLATSLFILLVLPISIFYIYTFYHLMNNPKMDGNRAFSGYNSIDRFEPGYDMLLAIWKRWK